MFGLDENIDAVMSAMTCVPRLSHYSIHSDDERKGYLLTDGDGMVTLG